MNMYQEALYAQSACNAGALVHALDKIVTHLQQEAREQGHGTDWINRHPVMRLFAEQLMHLSCETDYFDAYKMCEERKK